MTTFPNSSRLLEGCIVLGDPERQCGEAHHRFATHSGYSHAHVASMGRISRTFLIGDMNEHEREQLREALRIGGLDEADRAMSQLLDVANVEMLDAHDLVRSLEAMERLGEQGQARMFEAFLLLASRFPQASIPVLVEVLNRSPLSWPGRLSAAVIHEVLEHVPGGHAMIDRGEVVSALCRAIDAAAHSDTGSAREAIETLHDWAVRDPLPQAGPAIVRWLLRSVDEESPKEYLLKFACDTLRANGQLSLLSQIRERAKSLPPDHSLQRALKKGAAK